MTGADYTDDLALCISTPVQAESLLHSLEEAAGADANSIRFLQRTVTQRKQF